MNDLLTYALTALKLHFSPVPTRNDGSKAPAVTWEEFQTGGITEQHVRRWFSNGQQGIGFLCGEASGWLVMFEFEGRAVALGLHLDFIQALRDLGHTDLASKLQRWVEQSPSGGLHFYWRCPDMPIGNLKLAFNVEGQVLIETRGHKGFTVTAPSHGRTHKTGKPWIAKKGGPHTCPTLTGDEQHLVLELARTFNQQTIEQPAEPAVTVTMRGDSEIDDLIAQFNRQHTWEQILAGIFEFVGQPDRNNIQRLRFIGQDGMTGATINSKGTDRLIVWSGTAAGHGWQTATGDGLAPSYDKFSAWVHINHHGDRIEALKTLGLTDLDAEGDKIADSIQASKDANWPPATWPTITPLEPEPQPKPFPIDVLPDWMQTHIANVAHQIQVPVDLPATTALGSLTSILTGRAKVQITSFWTEPVNLFQVVAMRSGSGKSPAVNQTVTWVYDLELALEADSADTVRTHEEELGITQGKLQRARKAAAGGAQEGGTDVHKLREQYDQQKQALADARPPRLVVQDATPEGLINVLAHNTGVSIISPEAELFDMVTRGKSSERASLDIYLKGFSGEPYIKDRKGSNEHGPEAVRIPHANLSVCCTVQPSVLDRLCTDELLANRGFAQRFMYACPPDMVGTRNINAQFHTDQAAKAARRTYETNCRNLADQWMHQAPFTCTYATDAVDQIKQFKTDLEPRLRHTADLANLAEWVSKLVSSVVRIAAVLHLAHGHHPDTDITKDTVGQAIEIGEYWLQNAIILLAYRGDLHRQQTHYTLDWICERHPDSPVDISTAELQTARHGNRPARTKTLNLWHAADFVPALRTLEEHGYIVFKDANWTNRIGTGGAQITFQLNPNIPREAREAQEATM